MTQDMLIACNAYSVSQTVRERERERERMRETKARYIDIKQDFQILTDVLRRLKCTNSRHIFK